MRFEYEKTLGTLMTPEVVSALRDIRELKGRAALFSAASPETFSALAGTAAKREIVDANLNMGRRTLERILAKLQDEGTVEKVGAARSTAYRRKE